MLELLIGIGNRGQTYFPDSGPGSKYLLSGNEQAGYFGQVTAAEMVDGWQVAELGPLTAGTPGKNTGLTWLKFFYKGKVIYIAKQQVILNVSWNDVYNAGLVYGEQGVGLYPVGAGVDQFRYLTVEEGAKRFFLKARLPQGSNADPGSDLAAYNTDTEWNDLMYAVASTGTAPLKWANFTAAELSAAGTVISMMKETYNANVNAVVTRGGTTTVLVGGTVGKTSATTHWRPVLELFDPTGMVFNPVNVTGDSLVRILEITTTPSIDTTTMVFAPIDLYGTSAELNPVHAEPTLTEAVYAISEVTWDVADINNNAVITIETV